MWERGAGQEGCWGVGQDTWPGHRLVTQVPLTRLPGGSGRGINAVGLVSQEALPPWPKAILPPGSSQMLPWLESGLPPTSRSPIS